MFTSPDSDSIVLPAILRLPVVTKSLVIVVTLSPVVIVKPVAPVESKLLASKLTIPFSKLTKKASPTRHIPLL